LLRSPCALLERVAGHLPAFRHGLHIPAGAEPTPRTGQDHAADVWIFGKTRQRFEERVEHEAGERVETIGPVHGEHGDAVLDVLDQVLAHG
jgi:hypothetical protein